MFQLEVTSAAILCRIAQCSKKKKKAIYYQELTLLKVRAKNLNVISFILQTRKSRVLIIELEILANVHTLSSLYIKSSKKTKSATTSTKNCTFLGFRRTMCSLVSSSRSGTGKWVLLKIFLLCLGHGDLHEKLLEKVEDDIFLLSGHDNTSYGGTL